MADAVNDALPVPVTHYPAGHSAKSHGGPGMFTDQDGEPILVWIDVALTGRVKMIHRILAEGAEIATQHWDPYVHLMILSPSTVRIFDMYCHPDYMRPVQYQRYLHRRRRRISQGRDLGEEIWTSKVMLKENWVDKCFAAGRFLGEADNWAGLRAGGPLEPGNANVILPTDPSKELNMDLPEIQIIPATQRTGSPISVVEDQDMATDLDIPVQSPVADSDPAQAVDVETEVQARSSPVNRRAANGASYESPTRPFAITDSVPMSREASSGSQPMEVDPPSSLPTTALPSATVVAEPDDTTPKKAYVERDGSTPLTGSPSSPVVLTRERNGEFEIAPVPESEEEEETVEERTPRGPFNQTEVEAPSMDVDEEDEVEQGMVMEVDNDSGEEANGPASARAPKASQDSLEAALSPHQDPDPVQYSSQLSGGGEAEALPDTSHGEHANAEAGPSTPRFQSPQPVDDPSKLFEGYRFWVDLKRPDRTDLIRRIRAAGGQLVMTYDQATHVLVHDHKSPMWTSIIADVVKRGVWFMDFKWVVKCLQDNIRYPELGDHLNGGAPILLNQVSPSSQRRRKRDRTSEAGSQSTPTGQRIKQSPSTSMDAPRTGPAPHDADEIARLFQLSQDYKGGHLPQIIQRMQQSMPDRGYSDDEWAGLYDRWRKRTGRFAHIPRVKPNREEMVPVLKKLEQRAQEGNLSHERLLHELHEEFPSAYPTHKDWDTIWTEWMRKTGRFKSPSSNFSAKVEDTSPRKRRRDSAESSTPSLADRLPPSGKRGRGNLLSLEELDAIFQREALKLESGEIVLGQIGELLRENYGKYSSGTWQKYLKEWRYGTGKFEGYTEKLLTPALASSPSGMSRPSTRASRSLIDQVKAEATTPSELSESDVPVREGTGPSRAPRVWQPYTEEDFTRMGRYIVDNLPRQVGASPNAWVELAKEHPGRTPAALAQKMRSHRDDVHARARDSAIEQDKLELYEATYPKHASKDAAGTTNRTGPSTTAEAPQEAPTPSQMSGQPYTEEEKRMMAKYIVDRLPARTRVYSRDWKGFADEHPERTLGAWSQKGNDDQVCAYARGIAVERGKLAQFNKAFPKLSRLLAPAEPTEVIEVGSESDDPNYVDMTGIDSD